MATLHFEQISPERVLFAGDVRAVMLPGAAGDMTVMPGHEPTVATLNPGIIAVTDVQGHGHRAFIRGGFAEITGDRNPIHLSEHFAARTPFGTRIAHGLYTAGLISAVLGTRLPGPGAVYISQTLNFRAPVRIGDTVEVTVEVAELVPERRRARLKCTCSVAGETVLDGEALVKVPKREEADPLVTALGEHAEQIAAEVLAVRVHAGAAGQGDGVEGPAGSRFWVARAGS